jgi:hypothetical protein
VTFRPLAVRAITAALAGIAIAIPVLVPGLAPTPADAATFTPPRRVPPVGAAPIWQDNFSAATLDGTRWMRCRSLHDPAFGCPPANPDEAQWYAPGAVSVAGGVLRLTARRVLRTGQCQTRWQCGPGQRRTYGWESGLVSTGSPAYDGGTGSRRLFRPGTRLEVRARIPSGGPGLWPAIWLLPKNPDLRSTPEVDLVEFFGDQRHAWTNFHPADGRCVRPDGSGGSQCMRARTAAYGGGWHTYGVRWATDGRLTYLVDGALVQVVVDGPREPMHLVINLAVGGAAGAPTARTPNGAALEIDYVRAWTMATGSW